MNGLTQKPQLNMPVVNGSRISCDCSTCKGACQSKPGWFKPDEAEKVAEYLGITIRELFNDYLAVDWFQGKGDEIFVLSPATNNCETGSMFSFNPKGRCIFFENDKCKIHPVAPFECKEYFHEQSYKECVDRHKEVANSWIDKESYLENLLGYEPCATEPESFAEMFGMF
jgi:hypothetical protein